MDTVFVLFYWEVAPLCPKGTAKWRWWGISTATGNGEWVLPLSSPSGSHVLGPEEDTLPGLGSVPSTMNCPTTCRRRWLDGLVG
ncbi:hypothetical protein NC651_008009 [Populus alba x Populus x berolinensis]|nr:hypothetical protein NC651_008009 [Populus alba x Populus x berolinensis]